MRLAGKVAVITGAGAGQGKEAARLFASEGARVVVADIREDLAEQVAESIRKEGGQAVGVGCDVADPDENRRMIETALEAFDGIHVLYNNAATVARGPGGDVGLEEISLETWHRILSVNLTGVFLACRHAIPEMVRRGGGCVIITSTVGALVGQRAHNHAYVASKTALLGLTRNLAVEYAEKNIRVNCIVPGQIETEMIAPLLKDPEKRNMFIENTPMKRLGHPREIANVALFLASDESSFMTGSIVVADGGWLLL